MPDRLTAVRERPIIFSGPMVRAILEDRKTQTRRVIDEARYPCLDLDDPADRETLIRNCPHGRPGDRLWVRETWKVSAESNHTPDGHSGTKRLYVAYRAGVHGIAQQLRTDFNIPDDDELAARAWGHGRSDKWRPSRYMPRWASRLTLEICEVRVERVQEITAEDAMAEGCWRTPDGVDHYSVEPPEFHEVWDSLNAKRGYSWDSNPWVWVISFRRLP